MSGSAPDHAGLPSGAPVGPIQVVRCASDISIRVAPGSVHLPSALHRRVERHWIEHCRARRNNGTGRCFDGRQLSLIARTSRTLVCRATPYKWFIAQREDPGLRAHLGVVPVAVTGLTFCGDGVVIGLRSARVTQDGGCWELVPAGGMDPRGLKCRRPSVADQLIAELTEETGVALSQVARWPLAYATAFDVRQRVLDVGMALQVRTSANELAKSFAALPAREHAELAIVPVGLVATQAAFRGAPIAAVSRTLAAEWLGRSAGNLWTERG